MKNTLHKSILIFLLLFLTLLHAGGCDWSAMWDLRRAEKILNEAAACDAEFSGDHKARNAYRKAQAALEEAMFLARRRDINLARDKASIAKDWAEEALMWAEIYNEQIRKEKEALGTYKD